MFIWKNQQIDYNNEQLNWQFYIETNKHSFFYYSLLFSISIYFGFIYIDSIEIVYVTHAIIWFVSIHSDWRK